MTRVYLRGYAVRDTEDTDGPVPFVLATEGRKADGLDLRMDTLDLERFRSNPVLMYGHDYFGREALPIGRVDDPKTDGGRLLGGLVFDRNDDFAVKVEHKIRNRFLNAVSVGFDAHDIDDAGVPARWELFETSVVPLPMDPDATADDGRSLALARALSNVRAGKVLSTKNITLVEDAITALTALMESAAKADDEDDGRGAPTTPARLAAAQRRLALAERF
ncbi:hypothetical protein [Amycolatopsis palatopharyngis]|uniref:hypothetical protein n=1 Tax=Amycolatopsis palatopharyngis TaxID=187982 RepID=UPI000E26EA77|nr:hypothetical protein [Amycolatopsis palatopharyngis]